MLFQAPSRPPAPENRGPKPFRVIAFSFEGSEVLEDVGVEAAEYRYLSNFYDLGQGGLRLKPGKPGRMERYFRNAEAAFQATQFWAHGGDFKSLSGLEAQALAKEWELHEPHGKADTTYTGYGNSWMAMLEVLRVKFQKGSFCANELLKTGDAFLLAHAAVEGEKVWSDNMDGDGKNWLGCQLMLIRDELRRTRRTVGGWTACINLVMDVSSGEPVDHMRTAWQETLRRVARELDDTWWATYWAVETPQLQLTQGSPADDEPALHAFAPPPPPLPPSLLPLPPPPPPPPPAGSGAVKPTPPDARKRMGHNVEAPHLQLTQGSPADDPAAGSGVEPSSPDTRTSKGSKESLDVNVRLAALEEKNQQLTQGNAELAAAIDVLEETNRRLTLERSLLLERLAAFGGETLQDDCPLAAPEGPTES